MKGEPQKEKRGELFHTIVKRRKKEGGGKGDGKTDLSPLKE